MTDTTTPTTTPDAGPVTTPDAPTTPLAPDAPTPTTTPDAAPSEPAPTPTPTATTAGGKTIKASGDATAQQPEQDGQGGFKLTVEDASVQEADTILPVLAAGEGTAGVSVSVGEVRQGAFDLHFQSASGTSPQNVGVHYFVIGA